MISGRNNLLKYRGQSRYLFGHQSLKMVIEILYRNAELHVVSKT